MGGIEGCDVGKKWEDDVVWEFFEIGRWVLKFSLFWNVGCRDLGVGGFGRLGHGDFVTLDERVGIWTM